MLSTPPNKVLVPVSIGGESLTTLEHLPNAPIVEALLDIKAELPPSIDLNQINLYQAPIMARYPKIRQRFTWQGMLQLPSDNSPPLVAPSGVPNGIMFLNSVENRIIQVRNDGFSFSQLKPYDNWNTFRSEAEELWNLFLVFAKPIKVSRIALRFINKIDIPLPLKDLRQYLRTYPEVASELPQGLENFFMRIVFSDPGTSASVVLIQTIDTMHPYSKILPLIMDLDVSFLRAFNPPDKNIWSSFEQLRNIKNKVFQESLTSEAMELFK